MRRTSRQHSHFIFGVIQAGLASAVAAAIASYPSLNDGTFLSHWLKSWLLAWVMMLPFVLLAAPVIQKLVDTLTRD